MRLRSSGRGSKLDGSAGPKGLDHREGGQADVLDLLERHRLHTRAHALDDGAQFLTVALVLLLRALETYPSIAVVQLQAPIVVEDAGPRAGEGFEPFLRQCSRAGGDVRDRTDRVVTERHAHHHVVTRLQRQARIAGRGRRDGPDRAAEEGEAIEEVAGLPDERATALLEIVHPG